jgi:polysaccharide biosynthesis protein PslH
VAGWRAVLAAGGWSIDEISLASEPRPRPCDLVLRVAGFARGNAALESVTWSACDLRNRLAAGSYDIVVVVSVRAWLPDMAESTVPVVLDLVDQLSENYRQRAQVASGARRAALSALGHQHARIERRLSTLPSSIHLVCAGYGEAAKLGATWLPIFLTHLPERAANNAPDHDCAFIGSLRYEPNLDGLRLLAESWPTNRRLLVAGANPPPEVLKITTLKGWTLVADFDDVGAVLARTRLTVAPLRIATGLQIKVLEAAARAMPQVVTTVAGAGFEPDFIETVEPERFVSNVLERLDDPEGLAREAVARRQTVADRYLPATMARRLDELIASERLPAPAHGL